jgi:hypothetical protein
MMAVEVEAKAQNAGVLKGTHQNIPQEGYFEYSRTHWSNTSNQRNCLRAISLDLTLLPWHTWRAACSDSTQGKRNKRSSDGGSGQAGDYTSDANTTVGMCVERLTQNVLWETICLRLLSVQHCCTKEGIGSKGMVMARLA